MISNPKVSLKTGIIIILLFSGVVTGILFWASKPSISDEDIIAEKWLDAVSRGLVNPAIHFAEQLVSDNSYQIEPDPIYIKIAENEKISPAFFNSHFNEMDFKLWYDAWLLKGIADQAKRKVDKNDLNYDQKVINILFNTVTRNIESKGRKNANIPWPVNVYIRKFGLCDRQSWLLAELIYQAGYETQVVYLINPETQESPHTICEIMNIDSNGKAEFTTADPYSEKILYGVGIAELSKNENLMKKIWPEREDWRKALPSSIFWTPSYSQDYCRKNQLLFDKLKEKLGDRCPRFGEDPKTRLRFYHNSNKNKLFKNGLWFFPFRLIKLEMDIKKRAHKSKKKI